MKNWIIILAISALSTGTFAQEFKVPTNYELKDAEDYKEYEQDIIDCVNWLMNTPSNEQETKRKEASAFLITWISGSPTVSIELNADIVNFMKPNSELLIIFMGGWTKYVIESDDKDAIQGNLHGIQSVITFYNKNKENLKRDKNVEKYSKLQETGKLEAHLKEVRK